jgi:integrase/recombinase XerD
MKDSPEKISPLRRRMIEDMQMRKMSSKTQSGYIRAVRVSDRRSTFL